MASRDADVFFYTGVCVWMRECGVVTRVWTVGVSLQVLRLKDVNKYSKAWHGKKGWQSQRPNSLSAEFLNLQPDGSNFCKLSVSVCVCVPAGVLGSQESKFHQSHLTGRHLNSAALLLILNFKIVNTIRTRLNFLELWNPLAKRTAVSRGRKATIMMQIFFIRLLSNRVCVSDKHKKMKDNVVASLWLYWCLYCVVGLNGVDKIDKCWRGEITRTEVPKVRMMSELWKTVKRMNEKYMKAF